LARWGDDAWRKLWDPAQLWDFDNMME
jgi:hypothetical protein